MAMATATAASTIHSAHASVPAHGPHAGTHSAVHSCSSVAKPIGTVPRNSECVGSCVMTRQISGHSAYRSTLMPRKPKNSAVLRAK
jgi:hypothetical protein